MLFYLKFIKHNKKKLKNSYSDNKDLKILFFKSFSIDFKSELKFEIATLASDRSSEIRVYLALIF